MRLIYFRERDGFIVFSRSLSIDIQKMLIIPYFIELCLLVRNRITFHTGLKCVLFTSYRRFNLYDSRIFECCRRQNKPLAIRSLQPI